MSREQTKQKLKSRKTNDMTTTSHKLADRFKKLPRFLAACLSASLLAAAPLHAQLITATQTRISSFTPAEGAVGQRIVVTVTASSLSFQAPPDISPDTTRFQFRGPNLTFINATTTRIGTTVSLLGLSRTRKWTYSVTVPAGAQTGRLRMRRGTLTVDSASNFSMRTTGMSIGNLAQYNIIGTKVDGVERLAPQTLPATLPTAPNLFIADIGAAAGNHVVAVTLGIAANQPIMTLTSPSVPAQTPFFEQPINPITMAQFLAFRANSTAFGFGSWQGLTIDPVTALPVAHGFDFTFNPQTGHTTYAFWANSDRSHVLSRGTVQEPTSWPLNANTVNFRLIKDTGIVDLNLSINMLGSSFIGPFGEPCVRQP
jgi:hypothetical protein